MTSLARSPRSISSRLSNSPPAAHRRNANSISAAGPLALPQSGSPFEVCEPQIIVPGSFEKSNSSVFFNVTTSTIRCRRSPFLTNSTLHGVLPKTSSSSKCAPPLRNLRRSHLWGNPGVRAFVMDKTCGSQSAKIGKPGSKRFFSPYRLSLDGSIQRTRRERMPPVSLTSRAKLSRYLAKRNTWAAAKRVFRLRARSTMRYDAAAVGAMGFSTKTGTPSDSAATAALS